MVAAQKTQLDPLVKAASLLGVCVLARVCTLAGRDIPLSPWTPFVYSCQDCAVVLVFAALALAVRRPWFSTTLYAIVAGWIALNVPVTRVLATPLTWPLLRAAGGPLTDSLILYATWINIFLLLLVVLAAVALPRLLKWVVSWRWAVTGAVGLPLAIVLGSASLQHIDTLGLHRNPIMALAVSLTPRLPASAKTTAWRTSPFPSAPGEDLTRLCGLAAGRNVVMIHLESTAAQYLRMHGAAEDPMPNLTRLAEQAIVFEHAYTAYPESIKGLFAVLCATYPAIDTEPELYAKVRPPALPEVLRRHGYRTGLFHSGRFMYLGMEAIIRDRGYDTLEDAGDIGGERESSFGVDEESAVRRIVAWIDEQPRGQPFFLTYLPIAGHHPYATPRPGPFAGDQPIDSYRNALHYADENVGALLQALRERDLERNTLFILFGDHGEAFGQHPGNIGHTLFVYEENVRVPLLILAPGLIDEPIRVHRPASLVDVAPTVLDLVGLDAPAEYQGESLLSPEPRLALMFTDYSLGFLALRDERWKCIHQVESGRTQLFDVITDPGETADRAAEFADRTAAYRDHLRGWCAAQRSHMLGMSRER